MTYAEFAEFVMRSLWRDGDTIMEADVPLICKLAETRIARDLTFSDQIGSQKTDAYSQAVELPSECREIISVSAANLGGFTYITPHQYGFRSDTYSGPPKPFYTNINNVLHLVGIITDTAPLRDLLVIYYRNVPSLYDDDTSWLVDEHFDLYWCAFCIYATPYLREDQRVAMWAGMYDEIKNSVESDQANRKFGGSPLNYQLPGVIR